MGKKNRNPDLMIRAGSAIMSGDIVSVEGLYRFVSKRAIASILGLNANYFSNSRSGRLEEFTIGELISLAENLQVPFIDVASLFYKSILNRHEKFKIDRI